MSKPILIALLVVLLAGGGIAFAQTEAVNGLLGLAVTPEVEGEDEGQRFGEEVTEAVQDLGQEMDPGQDIPEVANEVAKDARGKEDENGEGEENRSPVADAVLGVLGGEDDFLPEDGEEFGEAVSDQAKDNGKELGENVSKAAKEKGKELGGNAPDAAGNANSKANNAR